MKYRILFVDDEPLVLQGLQRMLRTMRGDWEMEFISSGPAALERMAISPFDAVVADMRMPGMDGVEFLNEVLRLYPQTVRLILSGHADEQMVLRSVGITHQFLLKPCDQESLKTAVRRAFQVGASLCNPQLKQMVGRLGRLPSIPALYLKLVNQLQDPLIDLEVVAATVSQDIAMTAQILKLVNSAFFGLRRNISNADQAVTYLGVDTLKSLVLSAQAFSQFDGNVNHGFSMDQLWAHSLQVAAVARGIAREEGGASTLAEEAFAAGLLHDTGQLILAANLRTEYCDLIQRARAVPCPLEVMEAQAYGTTHAEVGGYLLGLWGLPTPIVEAIMLHHHPRLSPVSSFTALTAVHVAEALCAATAGSAEANAETHPDLDYLTALGLAGRLDRWREVAAETSWSTTSL